MNRHLRSAILGLAVTATAIVPVAAGADPLHHRDRTFERRIDRHHFRNRHRHNDDGLGVAIALGVLGLAVGAMVASQHDDAYLPRRVERTVPVDPGYYPPAPARNPDVVYYDDAGSFEPWTDAWRYACHQRYQTFDDDSGTFMGYDHKRHFCVIDD